jgi:hypothetical protein
VLKNRSRWAYSNDDDVLETCHGGMYLLWNEMLLIKNTPTWTITISKARFLLNIYSTSSQMPVHSIRLCVYRAFHGLEIQDKDFAQMRPSEQADKWKRGTSLSR